MKIGFIGLGIMGKPMAKNLLKAGYELVVYDIVARAGGRSWSTAGAKAGASPKDVAAQGDVIITMLPNSPDVKEAVLGKDGVIEGARPGTHRGGHELDRPAGGPGGRRPSWRRRASRCSTRRSPAASPRPSTARWPSWSAARPRSSSR